MVFDLETKGVFTYKFFPVKTQALKVTVKAPHDAHIALTSGPSESNPMYEVFIGAWENSKIAICRDREKPEVLEIPCPNVLNENEFRTFWITFYRKLIAVGINEENTPLLKWPDPELFRATYFGVRTCWGANGVWKIDDNWVGWLTSVPGSIAEQPSGGVTRTWVGAAKGKIPPNALFGGFDTETLYIGRALYSGGILPGKIVPSHGVCYVAWGGREHGIPEYEVLCDCTGKWLKTTGVNIPPSAIPGGKTEDGETLYIGRGQHKNIMAIGKVQKSHGVCYIPYGGKEIAKQEYEILVEP